MARLIHLNGAPGVGKSTLAERYVADRPGVLNCDVDRLRCFIGGWEEDFAGVGAIVRPVVLAMIAAHLSGGRDVMFPQMLASEDERARFRAVAVDAGHDYVHVLLQAPPGEARGRFYGRTDDPLNVVIKQVVEHDGGGRQIDDLEHLLAEAAAAGDVVRLDAGGDADRTYAALLGVLS